MGAFSEFDVKLKDKNIREPIREWPKMGLTEGGDEIGENQTNSAEEEQTQQSSTVKGGPDEDPPPAATTNGPSNLKLIRRKEREAKMEIERASSPEFDEELLKPPD